MKLILTLLTFLLLAPAAWGATYYVSQSGTGDGSTPSTPDSIADYNAGNAPFNNLEGDTVYFLDLASFSTAISVPHGGASGSHHVLRGDYGGTRGHLALTAVRCIYGADKSYLTIQGFEISGCTSGISFWGSASGVTEVVVNDCYIHDTLGYGVLFTGVDSDNYADSCDVTNSTIANVGTWGDTSSSSVGYAEYTRRGQISNNTIYGNGVDAGVDGILINSYGAGFQINGNTVYGVEENCLDMKRHQESAGSEGDSEVYDNTFYQSGDEVVALHVGTKGVNFHGNKIYGGGSHGIIIYNHAVLDPLDGDEGYFDIYNNVIYDNDLAAIFDGGSGASVTAGNNNVYNNTFAENGTNTGPVGWSVHVRSEDWIIKNNVFYKNGQGRIDAGTAPYQLCEYVTTITLSNNVYWDITETSGVTMWYYNSNARDLTYMQNTASQESGSIESDPLFIAPAAGEFQLQGTSPCIDTGTDVGVTTDFMGRVRPLGAGYDIGAYEYSQHARRRHAR